MSSFVGETESLEGRDEGFTYPLSTKSLLVGGLTIVLEGQGAHKSAWGGPWGAW